MKWPWVSRARFEAAERYSLACERNARALSDSLEREGVRADRAERSQSNAMDQAGEWIGKERARFDDLLAKYHTLKLAGAVAVEPSIAPPVVVPPAADPVREKIREQVRANPGMTGLGGYLSDYARELRDMRNMNPAQIVEALGKWESSEDYSAAVDSYVETAPTTDEAIAEVIA